MIQYIVKREKIRDSLSTIPRKRGKGIIGKMQDDSEDILS